MRDAGGRRMASADALAAAGLAPVDAGREGGARPHQRDRRHARPAGAVPSRTWATLLTARRPRRGRVDPGAARDRDRVFAADVVGAAAAPRPAGERGQPARAARRLADRRLAPRRRVPGPGRLLPALRPPGPRRRARHAGPRPARRRRRARLGHRQPVGPRRRASSSPTATSTARRSATCSTSWPSPRPTWPRSPSGAPTACSTPTRSFGLPPFLAHQAGVDSGLMIAQYTQAAMVAEMKRLARAGQRRLHPVVGDAGGPRVAWAGTPRASCAAASTALADVLAVELLAAARALALRAPLVGSPATAGGRRARQRRGRRPRPRPVAGPGDRRGRRAGALGRAAWPRPRARSSCE